MIGPRNHAPATCRHGHENTYALYPRTLERGWRWECKACNNDRGRRHRWGRPTGPNGNEVRQADRAEDIQFWRDNGYTHEDIATKLGIALESHYRWLGRHGIPT
jgi:hypothetical protein